ncbi:hypothetical protein PHPALM_20938 [Phytophthora palmivora]|uniref:Uncharacterized protein n=1 Tax=Phytophthora palmivora TaxID=4796 RepID=A0A2P4XDK5_9STRA|nr:hypothetical protein PHPALM_20938 [Phytophthora palmivora]
MEIQLNAAPEDEEVSPSVSHAVPMSSLLSDNVAEDEIVLSASPHHEAEDVEMEHVLPPLEAPELELLQTQLHTALNKLWTDAAPAPKRQKKSKQKRKTAGNNAAQELEIQRIMDQLQHLVSTQFAKKNVLVDVVKLSTSFCELLDTKDSVRVVE